MNITRQSLRAALAATLVACAAGSHAAEPPPLQALPSVDVTQYLAGGLWYQVALYPNRFQNQCVSDTTAAYRRLPDGQSIEVINRCRLANGQFEEIIGIARVPKDAALADNRLSPAKLEVSFVPTWLRALGIGWGRYWVIQLAEDARYAVVSEPGRDYLWVLSRTPQLAASDETEIRSKLVQQGFGDLSRLTRHPHSAPAAASAASTAASGAR